MVTSMTISISWMNQSTFRVKTNLVTLYPTNHSYLIGYLTILLNNQWESSFSPFIHLFIIQIFDCLLCAKHCSSCWGYYSLLTFKIAYSLGEFLVVIYEPLVMESPELFWGLWETRFCMAHIQLKLKKESSKYSWYSPSSIKSS